MRSMRHVEIGRYVAACVVRPRLIHEMTSGNSKRSKYYALAGVIFGGGLLSQPALVVDPVRLNSLRVQNLLRERNRSRNNGVMA